MSEQGPSEQKPSRLKIPKTWLVIAVVVAVVAVVLPVVMFTPSLSPIPSIRDTDADGVPDALDVFPNDSSEWDDSDSDGVGDNGDVFPNDSTETEDTDSDGVGDNGDAFPNDPAETEDTDSDGVGDNGDAFPNDPTESRDSDLDGIGDNADFWDSGDGGLIVRIELFELIAGTCDFFLSNCEPSFRLQVDIDQDGVTDMARRADFEDFLDTQPLVNPVSWTFDIPDDALEIDLILVVLELDFGVDDEIDVHPDPDFIAGWVTVDFPFSYVKFVTQGDQGAVGRLTYSVEAVALTLPPRSVSVFHPWSGSERDQFLVVLDAFTAKTGILVEDATFRQEQLQTLLPAQFSASTTPADVIFMPSGFIPDWGDQGWAMDVTGRVNPDDYIPGVVDSVTSGTTIYGAPYTYKPKPGFWYKDSLFSAMSWNQNPTTYAEFVALLDTIVADGMTPLVQGNGVGWPLSDMTEHFIATYGGAQMHRDLTAGTLSWTDPAVRAVFADFLVPLITAGYFDAPVAFDAGVADLWAEQNALYFQGSFILGFSQIQDATDMRFLPAPGGVATAGQVLFADYLFVPTFTTKQTEALALFDFLKGVEGQELQIGQPGHFPTFVNVDPTKAHPCCDPSSVGSRIPLPDMDDTVGGTWQTVFWAQLQLLWANPSQLDSILAAIEAAR